MLISTCFFNACTTYISHVHAWEKKACVYKQTVTVTFNYNNSLEKYRAFFKLTHVHGLRVYGIDITKMRREYQVLFDHSAYHI